MEHIVKSFTRVIRQIDEVDTILALVDRIEKDGDSFDPSQISDQDRRRVLDLPDVFKQFSNISSYSSLKHSELLERAANEPEKLTSWEAHLLQNRYWDESLSTEWQTRVAADEVLSTVSDAHWHEMKNRLTAVRAPLYEANEEKAIENAEAQYVNYILTEEVEPTLPAISRIRTALDCKETTVQRAPCWLKQFQQEKDATRPWGYPVFVDPDMDLSFEQMFIYLHQRDSALRWAMWAIASGSALETKWTLQELEWPVEAKRELPMSDRVQKLRETFLSLRDDSIPKRQRTGVAGNRRDAGGLQEGMLRNTFLLIDRDAVDSMPSKEGPVDSMWLWMIDPDYDPETSKVVSEDPEAGESSQDKYEGFLKVRLQQIVNNLFEARWFQEDTYSVKHLWEIAQKSRNQMFISTKEEEWQLWVPREDIGSALRQKSPE